MAFPVATNAPQATWLSVIEEEEKEELTYVENIRSVETTSFSPWRERISDITQLGSSALCLVRVP